MKIGIISDTHNFLDPKIPELFAGVAHIIHAGDVGGMWITSRLQQIAPVTAVMGNVDGELVSLKEVEFVELDGRKFLVQHIVEPREKDDELWKLIRREQPDAVVFGHSHKRFCQIMRGILFFNPGYAGQQRFDLDRSVAVLEWDHHGVRPEFHTL